MKKSSQGFMLVEALIMSVVVIGVLIVMYIQFQNINRSYDKSFHYNTVTGLYTVNEIKDYLVYNNKLNELKSSFGSNSYIDITQLYNINQSWKSLIDKGNVKTIILAKQDLDNLKKNRNYELSEKFKNYISYVKVDKDDAESYRLLIEFKDDTFATLNIGKIGEADNIGVIVKEFFYRPSDEQTETFLYTGHSEIFSAPVAGNYTLEVYGAQGGIKDPKLDNKKNVLQLDNGHYVDYVIPKGGFSRGIVQLDAGTNLYIYAGGKGICKYSTSVAGGFNAGGSGGSGWIYTEENYNAVVASNNEYTKDFATKWKLDSKYYMTSSEITSNVNEGDGKIIIKYNVAPQQVFATNISGMYKIQVLGPNSSSGAQKYIEGNAHLSANDKLYMRVGQKDGYSSLIYSADGKINQKIIEVPVGNQEIYSGGYGKYSISDVSDIKPADFYNSENGYVKISLISKD